MQDAQCVAFLQWALPRLQMRWPGFRKVRRQVCKRVAHRLISLGLTGVTAYRAYLETHPEEWPHLDELCWISISRFYRDRALFDHLATNVLPHITEAAAVRGSARIRTWSAGCCAGEEPYTLMLLWQFLLQPRFPGLELQILATDIDREQLDRARTACYPRGSLKELPASWTKGAFEQREGRFHLRPEFRIGVDFLQQDIRRELPDGPFDLVLCRNLVFTYFEEALQTEIAGLLHERIIPGGALVLGRREVLPAGTLGFHELETGLHIYGSDPAPKMDAVDPVSAATRGVFSSPAVSPGAGRE